ncbi:MAG: type IV secretory system conjugative DNA transfer family protein [Hyphomicrobiales bacterium]
MTDDPWKNLSKMSLPSVFDGGRGASGGGFNPQAIITTAKTSLAVSRTIEANFIKGRLRAAGYDPITIDAVVAAIKEGRSYEGILAAADQATAVRAKADTLRTNPPPIHGSARWAEAEELSTANFLQSAVPATGLGLWLGQTPDDQSLYWQGESHLLTVAPTRTGKGTMQIIPNLLRYQGSAVVLDPKGELASATAAWRAQHVGPVYILNPFAVAPFGTDTAAFNPLDQVTDTRSALKLAEMLFPRTDDERQRFFDNEAIGFLAGALEFMACHIAPAHRSLGNLRDTVSTLSQDFYGLLNAMQAADLPPSIRNAAQNVLTKTTDVGQPRLIDSLSQHLRMWDTPGLRKATAQSDFAFQQLKDAPTTVYLVLPFDELHTYGTYVRMVFASALDAMLANPRQPDAPVLFVLDEFLGLDADDRFVSALRTHASAGVRLWFFLQDLPTLEQKYPTTWKSFLQAEVKTFFGTDDPHTAKLISEYLGDTTISYDQPSFSPSISGNAASYSLSENLQLTGRPLLKPDEVVRHLAATDLSRPRSAIHFLRGVPPVRANLIPWFTDPLSQSRHSPLP